MNHAAAEIAPETGLPITGIGNTRKISRLPMDRQRAEFLRSCRARIQPSDLGLPVPQRKRTDGLRREDVAALSGVSVSWYTWLEQGREMRVSDEVLERICHTFRLSEDERIYLFSLVQHRPPRLVRDSRFDAPDEIVRMIGGLVAPAVVMNLRWDVLAWNTLNSVFFRDYSRTPLAGRNLAEILFTQPTAEDPVEFEIMARRVLAKLRVDYSKAGNDPRFESLIRRLCTVSAVFRRIWRAPEINVRSYGLNRFRHAKYGDLAFEHTSYVPDGHPDVRVVICLPHDAVTRQAVFGVYAETTSEEQVAGRASVS
ncbi:MAG: helix-turn-helix transcriptional regulator [Gammaproteobacteria bacterium]